MIVLLKYWREILLGLAVVAVVGFVGLALHWRKEAATERLRADAAVRQDVLDKATVQTVDRYHETSRVIVQKSEQSADAVQTLPGAEAPLDPALRDGWRAGIIGLRHGSGAPDDQRPAKPAS